MVAILFNSWSNISMKLQAFGNVNQRFLHPGSSNRQCQEDWHLKTGGDVAPNHGHSPPIIKGFREYQSERCRGCAEDQSCNPHNGGCNWYVVVLFLIGRFPRNKLGLSWSIWRLVSFLQEGDHAVVEKDPGHQYWGHYHHVCWSCHSGTFRQRSVVNFNLCAREDPRVWMSVDSVVSKEKESNDVLFNVEGDFLIKMMYLIITLIKKVFFYELPTI